MERAELVQKLDTVIHNMNVEGLKLMYRLMGDMHENKKYNIHTTPEQVAEIKKQEAEKEARESAERKNREQIEYMDKMAKEVKQREDTIGALTGKEKVFWNKIEKVKKMDISRYVMKWWQTELIAKLYNNNYINASYIEFCYGFYQGMQYMKNQANKRKIA